jgi:hypothetical protein
VNGAGSTTVSTPSSTTSGRVRVAYPDSYDDGVFRFFEHPVHFAREQAYEGKYVIQTEEPKSRGGQGGWVLAKIRSASGGTAAAGNVEPCAEVIPAKLGAGLGDGSPSSSTAAAGARSCSTR